MLLVNLSASAARQPVKTTRKYGQKLQRGSPASFKRLSRLLVQKTPRITRPYPATARTRLLPGCACDSLSATTQRNATNSDEIRKTMRPACLFKVELDNEDSFPCQSVLSLPGRPIGGSKTAVFQETPLWPLIGYFCFTRMIRAHSLPDPSCAWHPNPNSRRISKKSVSVFANPFPRK